MTFLTNPKKGEINRSVFYGIRNLGKNPNIPVELRRDGNGIAVCVKNIVGTDGLIYSESVIGYLDDTHVLQRLLFTHNLARKPLLGKLVGYDKLIYQMIEVDVI